MKNNNFNEEQSKIMEDSLTEFSKSIEDYITLSQGKVNLYGVTVVGGEDEKSLESKS